MRSAQIQVTSAEADLTAYKKQSERTQKLVEGGALAQRDLEAATTQLAASEARLEAARASAAQARERLGWANVTSPIDGVVSDRGVAQGDVVQVGASMFTVIDPSSMRLKASVSSEQLGSVSVGAGVTFQVRGYPDQHFNGVVERIAPAADELTRQIPIWVSIPNPEGKLVAGLFAEGRVASRVREALVLPLAAVSLVSTPPQVKRVVANVVEDVSVHVGLRDEVSQTIEVSDGVSDGDLVLRGAAFAIVAGTSVQVTGEPRRANLEASRAVAPAAARAD
jgi:RND family efflux transporter MFP subunit